MRLRGELTDARLSSFRNIAPIEFSVFEFFTELLAESVNDIELRLLFVRLLPFRRGSCICFLKQLDKLPL